jgi:hypothetical protein
MRRLLLLFLGIIPLFQPTLAQDLAVHVSADSVTVGQRFHLSVVAKHEFAADPVFPELTDSLSFGDLEVLGIPTRESYRERELRVDSIVYEVATFALDTARIAPIPILFTAGEDTFSVLTTESMIPVASLVPGDAEDIRDVAPIVEIPAPIWPYVAGTAVLLMIAAALAFYIYRRRKRAAVEPPAAAAPPAPPHVEALRRLRALEQVDLADRAVLKPFYVELADTLRHYLARRIHVAAMEATTGELVGDLIRKGAIPASLVDRLQSILTLSDFVKFADAEPPPEQGREALKSSRGFVQEVEQVLQEPSPEHV